MGRERREDVRHDDALQPRHLLLELHRIGSLGHVVHLREEAVGPLVDEAHPVRRHLCAVPIASGSADTSQ